MASGELNLVSYACAPSTLTSLAIFPVSEITLHFNKPFPMYLLESISLIILFKHKGYHAWQLGTVIIFHQLVPLNFSVNKYDGKLGINLFVELFHINYGISLIYFHNLNKT